MANGLLGGLSNAVNTGLNAYIQEKKYQDQKSQDAQANKLKNLGLIVEARKSGLLPTFTDETPTRALPEGEYESVVKETPEQPKALWDREISGFKTDPNYVDNKKLLESLGVEKTKLEIDKLKGGKKLQEAQLEQPYSQDQTKAANFYLQAEGAEEVIRRLESEGIDFSKTKDLLSKAIMGGKEAFSSLADPKLREYAYAANTMLNAALRRDSGATIKDEEFDSLRPLLFNQANDDPRSKQNKMETRLSMLGAMGAAAGEGAINQARNFKKSLREKLESKYGTKEKTTPQKLQPPKQGEARNGYIYQGGDPSDPKSWVKQ